MTLENLTALEWVPKITWTYCEVPTTFTLQIPQKPWSYWARSHGGVDVAASGVQESFVIRHDRGHTLRLRFTEDEWNEDVEPFLRGVMAEPQVFEIQADQSDSGTAEDFRLVSPHIGDELIPTVNPFDGVLEFEIVVRTEDGSPPEFPYFPTLGV